MQWYSAMLYFSIFLHMILSLSFSQDMVAHPYCPKPLVIAGPSGSGKSTLINRLIQEFPDEFGFSISRKLSSTPILLQLVVDLDVFMGYAHGKIKFTIHVIILYAKILTIKIYLRPQKMFSPALAFDYECSLLFICLLLYKAKNTIINCNYKHSL